MILLVVFLVVNTLSIYCSSSRTFEFSTDSLNEIAGASQLLSRMWSTLAPVHIPSGGGEDAYNELQDMFSGRADLIKRLILQDVRAAVEPLNSVLFAKGLEEFKFILDKIEFVEEQKRRVEFDENSQSYNSRTPFKATAKLQKKDFNSSVIFLNKARETLLTKKTQLSLLSAQIREAASNLLTLPSDLQDITESYDDLMKEEIRDFIHETCDLNFYDDMSNVEFLEKHENDPEVVADLVFDCLIFPVALRDRPDGAAYWYSERQNNSYYWEGFEEQKVDLAYSEYTNQLVFKTPANIIRSYFDFEQFKFSVQSMEKLNLLLTYLISDISTALSLLEGLTPDIDHENSSFSLFYSVKVQQLNLLFQGAKLVTDHINRVYSEYATQNLNEE